MFLRVCFNANLISITCLKAFSMIVVQVHLDRKNPFHLLMSRVKAETLNLLYCKQDPSSKCWCRVCYEQGLTWLCQCSLQDRGQGPQHNRTTCRAFKNYQHLSSTPNQSIWNTGGGAQTSVLRSCLADSNMQPRLTPTAPNYLVYRKSSLNVIDRFCHFKLSDV